MDDSHEKESTPPFYPAHYPTTLQMCLQRPFLMPFFMSNDKNHWDATEITTSQWPIKHHRRTRKCYRCSRACQDLRQSLIQAIKLHPHTEEKVTCRQDLFTRLSTIYVMNGRIKMMTTPPNGLIIM